MPHHTTLGAIAITTLLAACATSRAPTFTIPPEGTPLGVRFEPAAIGSPAPERAARFYARLLRLPAQAEDGAILVGTGDDTLRIEAGEADAPLTLAVDDLDALLVELSVRDLAFATTDDAIRFEDPDGRRVTAVTAGR